MAQYIGPVACYRKKAKVQIWESVNLHPMFTESVFLQMKNDSNQVNWRGENYSLEQTSALFENENEQEGGNIANKGAKEDEVYIDICISVPALLIRGNKDKKEVRKKIKKDYKDKTVRSRSGSSTHFILTKYRGKS